MTRKGRVPKLVTPKRVRIVLMKLLDLATPTLRDLAHEAGISYHAARAYRKGQRTPSPAILKRLAAAMRARGGQLVKAAATFERLAREQGRTPQPKGKP